VTNTTDETVVYTGELAAGALRVGNVLQMNIAGTIDEASASDFVTIRVKVGGVTMATIASPSAGIAAKQWHLHGYAYLRSVGASGSMAWHMDMDAGGTSEDAGAISSINTTLADDITVTAQWNNAKDTNIFTCTSGHMEFEN
jgi:hypothetical protein